MDNKGTITWLSVSKYKIPVGEELLFWIQGTFLKGIKYHNGYRVFFADKEQFIPLFEIHARYSFTHFAYINEPEQ